jgi:hypothetical protein
MTALSGTSLARESSTEGKQFPASMVHSRMAGGRASARSIDLIGASGNATGLCPVCQAELWQRIPADLIDRRLSTQSQTGRCQAGPVYAKLRLIRCAAACCLTRTSATLSLPHDHRPPTYSVDKSAADQGKDCWRSAPTATIKRYIGESWHVDHAPRQPRRVFRRSRAEHFTKLDRQGLNTRLPTGSALASTPRCHRRFPDAAADSHG